MKISRNKKQFIRNAYRNVTEYQRKTGTVAAHYTGMGPNKPVPNKPKEQLDVWLIAHGATQEQLKALYSHLLKNEAKTHDLIELGLLDVDNYLNALNKG